MHTSVRHAFPAQAVITVVPVVSGSQAQTDFVCTAGEATGTC